MVARASSVSLHPSSRTTVHRCAIRFLGGGAESIGSLFFVHTEAPSRSGSFLVLTNLSRGTAALLVDIVRAFLKFQKIMIALKKRLESLELSTERYHQKMAAQAQKELGLVGLLPLPPCSDIAEARIRLKRMVDALVKLPLGVKDPAVNEIVEEFRSWVRSEHERAKHERQEK